jgi:glycerophosphoryl diester phosphodiesterase
MVPRVPENTIPAFQKCLELGVDAIELDLRSTSDRKIIVLHDENVDRTTNGSGPVNALTLAEVKKSGCRKWLFSSHFSGSHWLNQR